MHLQFLIDEASPSYSDPAREQATARFLGTTRFVLTPNGPWACRERIDDRFDTDVGGTHIVVEAAAQPQDHRQAIVERAPVIVDWHDGGQNYTLEEAEQLGGDLLEPAKRLRERISAFAAMRSRPAA